MATIDLRSYDIAEDLYIMVIGPDGRWSTIPAKALVDEFNTPGSEVWVEINRVVSEGQLAQDFERVSYVDSNGDTVDVPAGERVTQRLVTPIVSEEWQEVSRNTQEVLIEDPNSEAELVYKQVLNIVYEMVSDGIVSYPAGARPRSTITLSPE